MASNSHMSNSINISEQEMNIYDLPFTQEVIKFLHTAPGFPTKATLGASANNGNLITFLGITI